MPPSSSDDDDLPGSEADDNIVGNGSGEDLDLNGSPDANADSSSAAKKDDNKPKSMLEAVTAALAEPKEEQSSSSGEKEGEEKPDPAADPNKPKGEEGAQPDPEDLTDEEFKALSVKTQKRIKYLVSQTQTLTTKISELEPQAVIGSTIQSYAHAANLSREDVNTGFNIMKLMKNDPVKAFEELTPIYKTLCALVGEVMPDDLVKKVNEGVITEADAKDLSKLRATTGLTEAQRKANEEAETQRKADEVVEEIRTKVSKTIVDWEKRQQASDPDYSLKQSRVLDRVKIEIAERNAAKKFITSEKDAIEMADRIKREVDAEMKKFLPKKTAIRAPNGSGATNGSKPVAKSLYDAVSQAVGHT